MGETFDLKKFLGALNPFDSVLWAKAAAYGLRVAVLIGLFVLVKTYLARPRVLQPITITNPSAPVFIGQPQGRKWVLTGMASDRAIGLTAGAEFGGRVHYGIGAQYDRDEQRWGPLIVVQLRF